LGGCDLEISAPCSRFATIIWVAAVSPDLWETLS